MFVLGHTGRIGGNGDEVAAQLHGVAVLVVDGSISQDELIDVGSEPTAAKCDGRLLCDLGIAATQSELDLIPQLDPDVRWSKQILLLGDKPIKEGRLVGEARELPLAQAPLKEANDPTGSRPGLGDQFGPNRSREDESARPVTVILQALHCPENLGNRLPLIKEYWWFER